MKTQSKPPVPLEHEVQTSSVALLRALGWRVFRRNVGSFKIGERFFRASERGQADLWGTLPDGRDFECEIKRPGKRPSAAQLAWLKSRNGEHCVAFWCDDTAILDRVARALMRGGVIVYGEQDDYDVEVRRR